jgi:hypothetical protein
MGYYAYVEVDKNKELSVTDENGINVGNPIATFFIVYLKFLLMGKDLFENNWFARFEQHSKINLRLLPLIMYAYDGQISEEEKQFILSSIPLEEPKQVEEIIGRLESENKWEDISEILIISNEYTRILPLMGVDTYWFSRENTIPAFNYLSNTIEKGIFEGGKKVRFHLL